MTSEKEIIDNSYYGEVLKNITKYLTFYGLYEERKGPIYKVYNNLTHDLYTWKQYSSNLKLNQHNLVEINVPI